MEELKKRGEDNYELGETFTRKVELKDFGHRGILNIRQNLQGRIMDIEKANLYNKYIEKIGQIFTGEVYQTWSKEVLILDEDGNELRLPKSEQIPGEHFKKNDSVSSNLFKVTQTQMKNLTALDDITINENFSLLLSLSNAWIKTKSRAGNNRANSLKTKYDDSGLSYGANFIYRPIEDVSLYFTYTNSLQKDDQGVNANSTAVSGRRPRGRKNPRAARRPWAHLPHGPTFLL